MSTAQPQADPFAQLRVLALAMVSALPILIAVVLFALGTDFDSGQPPLWQYVVAVAAVFGGYLLGLQTLRSVPALDPRLSAGEALGKALAALQANSILRFALAEAPVLALIVTAFVLDSGGWLLLVGGAIGIVTVFLSVWPTRSNVLRMQQRLEREGARSGLLDTYLARRR